MVEQWSKEICELCGSLKALCVVLQLLSRKVLRELGGYAFNKTWNLVVPLVVAKGLKLTQSLRFFIKIEQIIAFVVKIGQTISPYQ